MSIWHNLINQFLGTVLIRKKLRKLRKKNFYPSGQRNGGHSTHKLRLLNDVDFFCENLKSFIAIQEILKTATVSNATRVNFGETGRRCAKLLIYIRERFVVPPRVHLDFWGTQPGTLNVLNVSDDRVMRVWLVLIINFDYSEIFSITKYWGL